MLKTDLLTSKEISELSVCGSYRIKKLESIYGSINETNRILDIWPFVLADWMAQQMMYAPSGNFGAEWDIVFAEKISGYRLQGARLPSERKRWDNVKHTEFPKMFNVMDAAKGL